MSSLISRWEDNKEAAKKQNLRFIQRLKSKELPNLQETVDGIHDQVFSEINCLDCGNCCRSYTIVLTEEDAARISSFLGKNILSTLDYSCTPNDEILIQTSPCPFLGADNACSIYEVRPIACQTYPHIKGTDIRKRKYQMAENTSICPATYHILERLKAVI